MPVRQPLSFVPVAKPDIEDAPLLWNETYAEAVLSNVDDDPTAPSLERLFHTLPEHHRDNFVDALIEARGMAWIERIPLPLRQAMLRDLRSGYVSSADADAHETLRPSVERDAFVQSVRLIENPVTRPVARRQFRRLLLGNGLKTIEIRFRNAVVKAQKPDTTQLGVDLAYRHVLESTLFDQAADVANAMSRPLTRNVRTGAATRLPGTTLFVPGLGNVAPSAAYLFYLARHTDTLVLAYNNPAPGDSLRLLETYRGVPVPDALRGKLFVMGNEDRVYQPVPAAAGLLVQQRAELERRAEAFRIDTSRINVVAHSAGNNAALMAEGVLAEAGYADLVQTHIAIAPAVRGSLLLEDSRFFPLLAFAGGGRAAANAVTGLTPDASSAGIPEVLSASVDLLYVSHFDAPQTPRHRSPLLRGLGVFADGLSIGSDGLVDLRAASFVKSREHLVESKFKFDHLGSISDPEAAVEWLERVDETPDPNRTRYLKTLAKQLT